MVKAGEVVIAELDGATMNAATVMMELVVGIRSRTRQLSWRISLQNKGVTAVPALVALCGVLCSSGFTLATACSCQFPVVRGASMSWCSVTAMITDLNKKVLLHDDGIAICQVRC